MVIDHKQKNIMKLNNNIMKNKIKMNRKMNNWNSMKRAKEYLNKW